MDTDCASKDRMRRWIIEAGLVSNTATNQCKIVYEPDCASMAIQQEIHKKRAGMDGQEEGKQDRYTMNKNENHLNRKGVFGKHEKYILVDAGGGTVDIACHEILGEFAVKEILPPSGGPWGSCYIDDQFKLSLNQIFGQELVNEFKTEHPNVYMQCVHNFQASKGSFDSNQKLHHNVRLPADFIAWIEDKFEDDDDFEGVEEMVASSAMAQSELI